MKKKKIDDDGEYLLLDVFFFSSYVAKPRGIFATCKVMWCV